MVNNFIVLSADIIDSKKQIIDLDTINKSLAKLNAKFESELAAYFKLYRGDEIQCVLLPTKNAMKIVRSLRFVLRPLLIRIGLGIGTIDAGHQLIQTKLPNTNPWENNGEAFHLARQALEHLNEYKNLNKKPRTFLISAVHKDFNEERIVNTLLNLYDISLESWTNSQWENVHSYEDKSNLEDAAKMQGKSYQSVQRSVSKASWDEIRDCEDTINALIHRI